MKKNRAMRAASALLVAVLMTTCTISGTFAKYVTQASGADSARVAKWGVTITANGGTFAESYEGTGGATTVATSSAGTDVIAPGTTGNMVAMAINGTPEVKVQVKYESALDLSGWNANGAYYCPLVITVGSTAINGTTFASAAEFESAVETAINAYTAEYDANQNLATVANTPVVSWEWPFSGDDVKDTYLGDQAAASNAATVILSVTTTVTQID